MLRFKLLILRNHSPRWIIFLLDMLIAGFSILLAFLLRFNFNIPVEYIQKFNYIIPIVLGIRGLSFVIGKTYSGIIRHTSIRDIEKILIVISSGSLALIAVDIVYGYFTGISQLIPYSIILIDFIASVYFLTSMRLLVKSLYYEIFNTSRNKKNVIIFGTQELALLTRRAIMLDKSNDFKVVAFFDEMKKAVRKKLEGVPIYHLDSLDEYLEKNKINSLIIAKDKTPVGTKNLITEICLNHKIKVQTIPSINNWVNGELNVNQIKNIKIEDLLEREPINLAKNKICKELNNKVILISGAAGSIGSEIVRQVTEYHPKKIILLDQAESPLYDIELEILEKFNFSKVEVIIGDITNRDGMESLFAEYKPSIVYHAAAYKHVPMMEKHPVEAVHNNVYGTKILADLSVKYEVTKFIMISTDKAVNPTNVMGATKRIAEMYIQALNTHSSTNFITTRFGNVLGSNGSVIPRFRKQIEDGGPVTVTHPEVTRYFMTIPEACQLVLEASIMGNGGEIYIFDMGSSVKVANLARKMIKLSGLEIGRDIEMKYTGLRPGEKLYEELLNTSENTIPTYHPKIMIAKVSSLDFDEIALKINKFQKAIVNQNPVKVVRIMKEIVKEFISQNSIYEVLDQETVEMTGTEG
ncbi:MAG: polysaccharide biosynthesis protein [Bacteroidota bacterium]